MSLDEKRKITYTHSIHKAWNRAGKCKDEQRILMFKDVKQSIKKVKEVIDLAIKDVEKYDTGRAGHEWRVLMRIRIKLIDEFGKGLI